jgi:hypothetical protein
MTQPGFQPAISGSDRPHTLALDPSTTGICRYIGGLWIFCNVVITGQFDMTIGKTHA